jgi:microcystin-dependent protein
MPISIEADPTLAQGYIKVNGTTAATLDATGITTGGVPAGAVMAFAMNSAPSGWLAADGAAVSRSEYARLFTAVGTAHGVGNGSTTFNLPDLRGIFVRGSGSQTISGITYNKTFAAKEGDAFQNFTGTITTTIDLLSGTGAFAAGSAGSSFRPTGANTTRGVTFDPSTVARTSTETRPANIALLYCIKF